MSNPNSPASSSAADSQVGSDVLTPSRKVKALLAQFDDDSDSETPARDDKGQEKLGQPKQISKGPGSATNDSYSSADNASDRDGAIPYVARGRMAARLQEKTSAVLRPGLDTTVQHEPLNGATLLVENPDATEGPARASDRPVRVFGSDDELSRPRRKRRLLSKKKTMASSPASRDEGRHQSGSASLLFFPSPSSNRASAQGQDTALASDSDNLPDNPIVRGKERFKALVEKHRKQRLEREAQEIVKQAARVEQVKSLSDRARAQRGSSPADDSDEESDASAVGAGQRLSKAARPTRKASKKALDEMHRETQRMSRNMQLAHEARTKKKITKESLLARFNFALPSAATGKTGERGNRSTTASSAPTSDMEGGKEHVTPPTSPLPDDAPVKVSSADVVRTVGQSGAIAPEVQREDDLPDIRDIIEQPLSRFYKGKGKAVDLPEIIREPLQTRSQVRSVRVKFTPQDAVMTSGAESDSDLEIVTSKSNVRKYAVFENLPQKKARETASHLALRSLAHLHGTNDRTRSSMNTVQMESLLRKAARMQAKKEREEKLLELRAKGVVIQSAEDRDRDQQEVEDLVEKARQQAAEIQKREKEHAKKDGSFVKDGLDDDESDEEDGDFGDGAEDEIPEGEAFDSEEEELEDDGDDEAEENEADGGANVDSETAMIDDAAHEQDPDVESEEEEHEQDQEIDLEAISEGIGSHYTSRRSRTTRVVSDDEDEEGKKVIASPALPTQAKTPRSAPQSARKFIPGLQMSDDLPLGLTQAFQATMADSQTQEQDSLPIDFEVPSPHLPFGLSLHRHDSIDMVSDSQPASQTQPLGVDLSLSQSQAMLQSPRTGLGLGGTQLVQSQVAFEPTQDDGFMFSPFKGSRFGQETPKSQVPYSTIDTVILPEDGPDSPIVQRKSRLRRGHVVNHEPDDDDLVESNEKASAFEVMSRAAQQKQTESTFDRIKSHAKDAVDEAAEESDDEFAGLGGASDEDADEENEDDRRMIDHDTQIGKGDEAKLAGLHADRERQQDEAQVSKLLKDITTGALRRKRGVGDDLDLSDEEDAAARRREAKRREFAKMRRELLKDEAVEKIADDKKKEAFFKSIEDRDDADREDDDDDDDDDDDFDRPVTQEQESQSQQETSGAVNSTIEAVDQTQPMDAGSKSRVPLERSSSSTLNRLPPSLNRTSVSTTASIHRKPTTLAEIRDSVSFLIDDPDSQSGSLDLGLDDSDDDPEAYVNLDRHVVVDENADDDGEDLGDFIVDDDAHNFKRPELPRASFTERRTKSRNVVDRLSLLRQSSTSSSSISAKSKMAFFTSKSSFESNNVPSLLRRATSNSSFGSMAGRDKNVSATGVTTYTAPERGVGHEKEFVRKGTGSLRNAVNFRAKPVEEKMSQRAGVKKRGGGKKNGKGGKGFLGALFSGGSFE